MIIGGEFRGREGPRFHRNCGGHAVRDERFFRDCGHS